MDIVFCDAARNQDTQPGRLSASYKFAVLPQLEEAGLVERATSPEGTVLLTFSVNAFEGMNLRDEVSGERILKQMIDNQCGYDRSVLEGDGPRVDIDLDAVYRYLRQVGVLMSLCILGLIKRERDARLGTFFVTKKGQRNGLGRSGGRFAGL